MRLIAPLAACLIAALAIHVSLAAADEPAASATGTTYADQSQPASGQGQMGPAGQPGAQSGGKAPSTPEELQRRQEQLDRVNRLPSPPGIQQGVGTPPAPGSQTTLPSTSPPRANCQMLPSFAPMAAVLPGVGDCVFDAYTDPASGDTLQVTTGGLLVERAVDGTVAFTDGQQTWLLAADGQEAVADNA